MFEYGHKIELVVSVISKGLHSVWQWNVRLNNMIMLETISVGCNGTRQNLCFDQLLPRILFVLTGRIGRMIEFLRFTEDRFAQVIAARF